MRDLYAFTIRVEDGDLIDLEGGDLGEKRVTISAEVPAGPLDHPEEYGNPSQADIGEATRDRRDLLARLVLFTQMEDPKWECHHNLDCLDSFEVFEVRVTLPAAMLAANPPDSWFEWLHEEDDKTDRLVEERERITDLRRQTAEQKALAALTYAREHPDADPDELLRSTAFVLLSTEFLRKYGQGPAADEIEAHLASAEQRRVA